jgi:hypothetical protein
LEQGKTIYKKRKTPGEISISGEMPHESKQPQFFIASDLFFISTAVLAL